MRSALLVATTCVKRWRSPSPSMVKSLLQASRRPDGAHHRRLVPYLEMAGFVVMRRSGRGDFA
jgi:hypothetical protein